MSKRKQHESPFNPKVPPLFLPGGLLDKVKELGPKVRFMVEMPADHFSSRTWINLYDSARRELADIVFLQERTASFAELSQLNWLKESGHALWFVDQSRPRCNILQYVARLERIVIHHTGDVCGKCNCDCPGMQTHPAMQDDLAK